MKNTLSSIQLILNKYIDGIKSIDVQTDENFFASVKSYRNNMLDAFCQLRDEHPELLFCNYPENITLTEANRIFDKIRENAKTHYDIPLLPSCDFFVDTIQDDIIVTPSFTNSLQSYNNVKVGQLYSVKQEITQYLLCVMLSLPIKKMKFTFVDIGNSYITDFFYKEINPILYNQKPIIDIESFKTYLKQKNEQVLRSVQQYGDVREYNIKNKNIIEPYEVIVLLNNVDVKSTIDTEEYETELNALIRNSAAGGVFVIDFSLYTSADVKIKPEKEKNIEKINRINNVRTLSTDKLTIYPVLIEKIPMLRRACVEYLNKEAAAKEDIRIVTMDISKINHYETSDSTLQIPVGIRGQEPIDFNLDIVSHVHAFILGQSGSGKSVFLHSVICGAMLKYSPEDLEMYLLDFKLGGVEFNRYKGEKHVHAMLVDNSDVQVTLEILRELRDRMTERGKVFRRAGVTNIKEYNELHSDSKMKQILFIADECHEMFKKNDSGGSVSTEISDIIVKIAKEGRNQGVHLILATQTIANTEISREILNNITDHYLLKCAVADSETMVERSADITSELSTGNVYYHHVDNSYTFQAYFANKKQSAEIMKLINKLSESSNSNETFYFNGASVFRLNKTDISENSRKYRNIPIAFAGKSVDITQQDVLIALNKDFSENILLVGLNDEYQSTRTALNLLLSLLLSCSKQKIDVDFKVIDCLSAGDKYAWMLDNLAEAGLVDVVHSKERKHLFKKLSEDIMSDSAKETILFIFGQDRFRELKLDLDIEETPELQQEEDLGLASMITFGTAVGNVNSVRSFKQALDVILTKGPECGVHTVIQLEKTTNYLFNNDYLSTKELYQRFKHLLLLKSYENTASQLSLRTDIRLENLSKDEDRLRAYYYAEENDEYTLFTPYYPFEEKELQQFIKSL